MLDQYVDIIEFSKHLSLDDILKLRLVSKGWYQYLQKIFNQKFILIVEFKNCLPSDYVIILRQCVNLSKYNVNTCYLRFSVVFQNLYAPNAKFLQLRGSVPLNIYLYSSTQLDITRIYTLNNVIIHNCYHVEYHLRNGHEYIFYFGQYHVFFVWKKRWRTITILLPFQQAYKNIFTYVNNTYVTR